MALGPSRWIPTPLEIGVFFTVWPQLLTVLTAVALIAPMWLIRAAVTGRRRMRRR